MLLTTRVGLAVNDRSSNQSRPCLKRPFDSVLRRYIIFETALSRFLIFDYGCGFAV